jgi:hypothetical protein
MTALTDYQEGMLKHIYYDQKNFFGRDKLYDLVKDNPNHPSKKQIMAWLKNQETHQLHLRPKRSTAIRPIVLNKPDTLYQMDLIDMGIKNMDRNYRYILVLVDAFSKKAYTKPLITKTAEAIFKAFREIYDKYRLDFRTLMTDNGSEFKGKLEEFLKNNDIKHITGIAGRPQSQGIVERLNGTIKNLIYKNQTATDSKGWKDVLPQLVDNYNNSIHRSTGERPDMIDNPNTIQQVATKVKSRFHKSPNLNDPDDLKEGDKVRIKIFKNPLEKASTQNWSKAIYKIERVIRSTKPYARIRYKLKDSTGELVKNNYVRNDIQLTKYNPPEPEPEPEPKPKSSPRAPRTPKPITPARTYNLRSAKKKT